MKNIFALVICLLIIFTLIACNSQQANNSPSARPILQLPNIVEEVPLTIGNGISAEEQLLRIYDQKAQVVCYVWRRDYAPISISCLSVYETALGK